MKNLPVIVLLALTAVLAADPPETPPGVTAPHETPRAWLGLQVSKPDATITAQLPSLPPGMGFIVRSIDKDGPAAAAGLREFDILWKLGDQMLVNEGQLAALLRLAKPGDHVVLAGFRAGKPLEVTLKLGETPAGSSPFPDDLLDASILPAECGGPMRVVNLSEKLATYSGEDGSARIRREGSVYHVTIKDPAEQLIYQGEFAGDSGLDAIPPEWRRRIHGLRRGLDHALDGRLMPQRQPRPRVVPPPTETP
jgi:hypothetical protein